MRAEVLRRVSAATAAVVIGAAVGCGGGGSGGGSSSIIGGVVAPSFSSAARADTSGQEDAVKGTIGTGLLFTFAAVQGVNYIFTIESKAKNDSLVVGIYTRDGGELKAKDLTTNDQFGYQHQEKSQHIIVLVRPAGPLFDTTIDITKCRVQGLGANSQTTFSVNFVVAGDDFAGYGNFNNLAGAADRAAFTNAVMAKVRSLFQPAGIDVQYEGFTMTASQIMQTAPTLVTDTGQAIAGAGEAVSPQGFGEVNTNDLDSWGSFGFAANDPAPNRANGIDVFVLHHFTQDGVVGLSPRPGTTIKGNGPGSALAVGAFQQAGTQFFPRTADQIGIVLAHELGHFLGLLHTTTFSPTGPTASQTIDDGLSDTPAAGVLTDQNGDGVVGLGDGCKDENNIMFWQAGNQSLFSTKQVNVLKTTLSAMPH